ncbi:MAG: 4Fe-4S dicluster domain-containing protein [Deltaproteobacteria bacterium]|nr:4Fe-4S dicluster domain-containing protein [Deltaproteobacteria bacterium]
METNVDQPLIPSFTLAERLAKEAANPVSACFQCKKCSAGCPLSFAMDLLPDRVIRLALMGQTETLLGCRTIWVCASCVTCTTRCPNGIDIAGVMDWLKEESLRQGKAIDQPEVAAFQRFFLDSLRRAGGRLPEVALMRRFTLYKLWRRPRIGELLENMKLGWAMMRRGRLRPAGPKPLKGRNEINEIFRRAGA